MEHDSDVVFLKLERIVTKKLVFHLDLGFCAQCSRAVFSQPLDEWRFTKNVRKASYLLVTGAENGFVLREFLQKYSHWEKVFFAGTCALSGEFFGSNNGYTLPENAVEIFGCPPIFSAATPVALVETLKTKN